MKRDWKTFTGALMGIAIAGAMVFANQLGMDNNPIWGAKRYILFFLGIFIFTASMLYREDNSIGRVLNTRTGQLYFASAFLALSIILVYAWCISVGLWTTWPETTNYYDLLAASFSHGQLALEVEPDPALLALEYPYEPDNREGIPVLWDATFYGGKYHLYWGPAPALLLALVKPFYTNEIGDNVLAFVFLSGMFIFTTLLILEFWKNHYAETPRWAILLGIAFAGLVNPIPFMLLDARIYEAAVAGGQFFFIGGLYWLLSIFNKPSTARLTMAGIFFALAAGSRTILIVPVAFLALVILIWAMRSQRARAFAYIAALVLPLVIGASAYAWYNYARFGSIAEFGYHYQLTSFNLYEYAGETFSIAFIPPNLFKTLLNPLEERPFFPFIRATLWAGPSWFEGYNPNFYLYLAEGITGILVGSPFVVFALLAGIRKKKDINWIYFSLAGSTLLTFLTLQVFFYTVMRYLLDLIPVLSLLAVIGFWQGLRLLQSRLTARVLLAILGIGLCAYSFAVGFLLTISSHLLRFDTFNPDLLEQLKWTFNGLFQR